VLVLALRAGHGFGHLEYRLLIYMRNSGFAAIGHEELRRRRSAKHPVLTP
jgi:hypothetical protein